MDSFKDWLIKREKFAELVFIGVLSLIAIIWHQHQRWIQALLDWCQVAMIAIVLCFVARDEKVYGRDRDQAGFAVKQFLQYWNYLWWLWLVLYMVFAFRSTTEAVHDGALSLMEWKTINNFIANLANNFQSFFIFLLFLVMSKKTSDPQKASLTFASRLMLIAIVLLAVAELCFSILAPFTLRAADPATLAEEDVKDWPSFAQKVRAGVDPVSNMLKANLSTNTQQELKVSDDPKVGSTIRSNIVKDLNSLIHTIPLYEEKRFSGTLLSSETTQVLEKWNNVQVESNPDRFSKKQWLARANRLLLEDAYPLEIAKAWVWAEVVGTICSICSGLFAGVSFCLFFGRLGSHFIRLNSGAVAVLYLYAAIQPLYPSLRIAGTYSLVDIDQLQVIQIALKILAATLKLVLFLRVHEIIKDSRLFYFMERVAADENRVAADHKKYHEHRLKSRSSDSEPN